MKAVWYERTGPAPEVLTYGEMPTPNAGPGEVRVRLEASGVNPAGRFGDPEEFGYAFAFLCGAKAGFITGQNILLDGGAFPGTL